MALGEIFTLGGRIRYYRERAGMSQRAFGELMGKSENWAWKVEHDQLPIDRISVLVAAARLLKVRDLSDLTGGYLTGLVAGPDNEHEAVPEIRKTLTLPTSLLPAHDDAFTADEFNVSVEAAWRVYETQGESRYADVGAQLPTLLRQGHAALRTVGSADEPLVLRQLISLYGLHQIWLRRVGEPVLARIAADRGVALADSAGDPALLAAATWNLTCVLTTAGDVRDSLELSREMIANCAPGDDATDEHYSAFGALHLQGAVAAVRANESPVAWNLFHEAERIATKMGDSRNDWHACFGTTNVAMHSVHLAAEDGDASEALRLADTVEVGEHMPLERRTRYLIEVMNCNRIQRDDFATVFMLKQLCEQSPEEIRYSAMVREAVTDLMKRQKPTWGPDLRRIADHMGMTS